MVSMLGRVKETSEDLYHSAAAVTRGLLNCSRLRGRRLAKDPLIGRLGCQRDRRIPTGQRDEPSSTDAHEDGRE